MDRAKRRVSKKNTFKVLDYYVPIGLKPTIISEKSSCVQHVKNKDENVLNPFVFNVQPILQTHTGLWKVLGEKGVILVRNTLWKPAIIAFEWLSTSDEMEKAHVEHRREVHRLM